MKKLLAILITAVLALGIGQSANATDGLMKRKVETVAKKTFLFYPEGHWSGPVSLPYSSTGSVPISWYGDPLPAGAFYSIGFDHTEYASAGRAGNEFGSINIPMSEFGGTGSYIVSILYWDGGILYAFTVPVSITLY